MSADMDKKFRPRPYAVNDKSWVHGLNTVHEVELSPLTEDGLHSLMAGATYSAVVDDKAAFIAAFDQDAVYESPNFQWFRQTLPRFVYVDRIAVDKNHHGQGIARQLYEDLFDYARANGHDKVVCEVNAIPPNPGSDAFHAAKGFTQIGAAELPERGKSVSYLCKTL